MARGRTASTRRPRVAKDYERSVFINVPFDTRCLKLFRALIFAVHDCGLVARCALESDDGCEIRFDKLIRIIGGCRYGIHDISRTTLDMKNRLPRFNMPLELGLFLGAKRFGNKDHQRKGCLILERERFRYQKYCSDIAGQDVRAHDDRVDIAIRAVRNWLAATRPRVAVPSASRVNKRYLQFCDDLPAMCKYADLDQADLTFLDFSTLVVGWLEAS